MKCISLWQPWATLIAVGAKLYETRSWHTSYQGPLAIHAAKLWTDEQRDISQTEPFRSVLIKDGYHMAQELPRGAIIAVVTLVACHTTVMYRVKPYCDMLSANQLAFGDWGPGRYAWELTDVRRLVEPIPYRGRQGLWTLEPEIAEKIRCLPSRSGLHNKLRERKANLM